MLNELKKILLQQENENNTLTIGELLEENSTLRDKADRLQKSLDSALDELVSSQKRIDALLRQLKEKNGGQ